MGRIPVCRQPRRALIRLVAMPPKAMLTREQLLAIMESLAEATGLNEDSDTVTCEEIEEADEGYVMPASTQQQRNDQGEAPEEGDTNLPTGIASVTQWGRTKITWGKAAFGKVYKDIHSAHTPELLSYKRFVLRLKMPNPLLKDLQMYLLKRASQEPQPVVLKFPGTERIRVLVGDPGEEEPVVGKTKGKDK